MQTFPPVKHKASGWRLFIKSVLGRSYPRIIGQQREKSWMFFDIVFPLLSVVSYVFVYRAIEAPEDYIGFAVLGGAMTAFWLNILWSMSTQLYWEKQSGNLALYVIAPAPLTSVLLGMAFGGLVATTLRAAAVLILGSLLFKVQYVVSSFPLLILIFFVSMVALYGMGMMMSSLFLLFNREAWHMANLLQEPIYLVSGYYFPVKSLGVYVAGAASLLPLTLGMDAIRQLIFASGPTLGFLSVQIELLLLILLSVIYLISAKYLLAHIERLAVKEGRLMDGRR